MAFKNSSQIQWIIENEDINGSTIPNDPDVSISPPNRAINDVFGNTIENKTIIDQLLTRVTALEYSSTKSYIPLVGAVFNILSYPIYNSNSNGWRKFSNTELGLPVGAIAVGYMAVRNRATGASAAVYVSEVGLESVVRNFEDIILYSVQEDESAGGTAGDVVTAADSSLIFLQPRQQLNSNNTLIWTNGDICQFRLIGYML